MRACRNIMALTPVVIILAFHVVSAPFNLLGQETETLPAVEPGIIIQENSVDDGEHPDGNNDSAGEQLPHDGPEQETTSGNALNLLLAEANENTVYNEEQLMDWYVAKVGAGGTVSLGCNIVITEGNFDYNMNEKTPVVTIDTGEFGLIYDGGALSPGDFMLTGEGVDTPVLTVIDPGIFRASWAHSIQGLSVTATGRDGVGGVAVSVGAEPGYFWDWPPLLHFYKTESLICSFGTGAVGLELEGHMEAYCLNIQVEGENSVAVNAPKGADLYYCKLKASGAGGLTARGGDILLDTCSLSPAAQGGNITVIQRRIIGLSGSRFYLPVPLNNYTVPYQSYIQFLTELSDGTLAARTFFVYWDDAIDVIDLSEPSRTTVSGRFLPPFEGLGLTEDLTFALELVVDVRDPALPTISDFLMFDDSDDGEKYVCFEFWESDAWEAVDLILWRSDDAGATWYDYTGSDNIEWGYAGYSNGAFYFYYDEITDTVYFQLEAPGHGESNIVMLYSTDVGASVGDGGDRSGADRIIGIKPGEASPSDNGKDPGDEAGTDNDVVKQTGDESGAGNPGNDDLGAGTPGDGTGIGDNGSDDSDSAAPYNGTGAGNLEVKQPGDEYGSGDNESDDSDDVMPGDETAAGDNEDTRPGDESSSGGEADSFFSIMVLAAVPNASAFASGGNTGQGGTATDGEAPPAFAGEPANSLVTAGEGRVPRAQPSVPEPAFPLGTAMALTGSGVILLAGLSAWIRARRLRGR